MKCPEAQENVVLAIHCDLLMFKVPRWPQASTMAVVGYRSREKNGLLAFLLLLNVTVYHS